MIGRELGRGNNGVVLAARHPLLGNVVLKKAPQLWVEDEAQMLWHVHHPNLVRLYSRVSTTKVDPIDCTPLACLALERLGPDLACIMDSQHKRVLSVTTC